MSARRLAIGCESPPDSTSPFRPKRTATPQRPAKSRGAACSAFCSSADAHSSQAETPDPGDDTPTNVDARDGRIRYSEIRCRRNKKSHLRDEGLHSSTSPFLVVTESIFGILAAFQSLVFVPICVQSSAHTGKRFGISSAVSHNAKSDSCMLVSNRRQIGTHAAMRSVIADCSHAMVAPVETNRDPEAMRPAMISAAA